MMTPLQRELEPICLRALSRSPRSARAAPRSSPTRSRLPRRRQGQGRRQQALPRGQLAAAATLLLAAGLFFFSAPSVEKELAEADRLLSLGKMQEATVLYDRVLAKDGANATALEGRKTAQKRISAEQDAEKRRFADEARREERARAKDNEEEIKARLEARRKATKRTR
jgi:hypothetical protein